MRLACYRIGTLLSRESSLLSEADRLQIESHRADCGRCRRDVAFDEALAALAGAAPVHQQGPRVERAIAAAFAAPQAIGARPPGWRGWQLGLAGAAVCAAAIAIAVVAGGGEESLAIEIAPAQIEPPEPEPEPDAERDGAGELAAAASHRFAHAEVTATAASRYRWAAGERRLTLEAGALRVQVTPNTGRSFTVSTPAFDVVVVGTDFDVDGQGVAVRHGVVRVTSRSGEVLAEHLGAGESWRLDQPAGEPENELEIDEDLTDLEPASTLLERASRQMRSQEFARAQKTIRQALRSGPSRRERAEAETLRAEIALANGDLATAVDRYRSIARRFGAYPQGESALFAAARLESKRGRTAAARALLERYRARYPRGRFAREVAHKLRLLGGSR